MHKWLVLSALLASVSARLAAGATPIVDAPAAENTVYAGDTDWRYYNRTPSGDRFSPLADINARNVRQLREMCRVRVSGPGPFSSSITLAEGLLYVTSTLSTVALDATTCDVRWKSNYVLEEPQAFNTHRGVGIGAGVVVRGTTDARLVAYDAASGQERWRTKIGNPAVGEFVSSAPQVWDDKVFVGVAGSDWGIQGRVMAFDVHTGARLWSFNTIPQAGEMGAETWAGDSFRRGGGGTWTSYTLDPSSGELFVPVGNPAMSWNGAGREGDNLYSNSVLVLDARSGAYRWHYQALAHDTHDYDLTSPPILATLRDGRALLAVTPKDGFLHVLDRRSHALLYKAAANTIFNQDAPPSETGERFCPGIYGGSLWNGPAFDPGEQSFVTAQTDWCTTVRRSSPVPAYTSGGLYMGGTHVQDSASSGWVMSFEAATGRLRWKYHTAAPLTSGVTPTAGNVTFLGDMAGLLYAFRSHDGVLLKKIDTHGAVAGGVITYRAGGRQYLAVNTGNISRSSWPSAGGMPSVAIYALPRNDSPALANDPGDPVRGKRLFNATCTGCHGENGSGGGGGPVLTGVGERRDAAALVRLIEHPPPPMPALFPASLSRQDVRDVARYVATLH